MAAYGDLVRAIPFTTRTARLRESRDLLEAGELAQGLIDYEFKRTQRDAMTPLHRAALGLVRAVAEGNEIDEHIAALERCDIPEIVESKVPEGFAFYAVYPELYARAARQETANGQPATANRVVIGIRTIGTTLGAAVAAAAGAGELITVRPTGHPFRRELHLDYEVDPEADYFIVDEGPGLSGSSFGCVADWLEERGVAPERIVFFPSHDNGPGGQADPRHVERWWWRSRRAYVEFSFDDIRASVEQLTGRMESVRDIGAGAWREVIGASAPVWINRERRKYLVRAGG
jgi:hypothetical protein